MAGVQPLGWEVRDELMDRADCMELMVLLHFKIWKRATFIYSVNMSSLKIPRERFVRGLSSNKALVHQFRRSRHDGSVKTWQFYAQGLWSHSCTSGPASMSRPPQFSSDIQTVAAQLVHTIRGPLHFHVNFEHVDVPTEHERNPIKTGKRSTTLTCLRRVLQARIACS